MASLWTQMTGTPTPRNGRDVVNTFVNPTGAVNTVKGIANSVGTAVSGAIPKNTSGTKVGIPFDQRPELQGVYKSPTQQLKGRTDIGTLGRQSVASMGSGVTKVGDAKGLDNWSWNGQVPTFKDKSSLGQYWDKNIAGWMNSFNSKDNPKTAFGKSIYPVEQTVSQVFPNALGNRSGYERITGKRPPDGTNLQYPENQMTPSGGQAPGGGVQGMFPGDPNQGPFSPYDVQFPDYTKPAWTAEGVLRADETKAASIDPIANRYKLLQENLKASEASRAGQEQDALNRRFASMGAGRSGASQRAEALQGDTAARRFGESRNALMASQSGEEQAALEAMKQRNLAREQLRLGSQEAAMAGMTDIAKAKLGNIQFGQELDLNRAISAMNADLAWQTNQANQQGFIQQQLGGMFGNNPVTNTMFGFQQPQKNPYLNQIQNAGGGPQYQPSRGMALTGSQPVLPQGRQVKLGQSRTRQPLIPG